MCTTIAITWFANIAGRTTIFAEIGKVYAVLGKRVLLIDGAGSPELDRLLGTNTPDNAAAGFCEAVLNHLDPALLVRSTSSPNLSLLGPGENLGRIDDAFDANTDDLVTGAKRTISSVADNYDIVLMHTPTDKSAPATTMILASADVLLTLAPQGVYGAQPVPQEFDDLRSIRGDN